MKIEILQLIEGAKQARGLTVIIDVFRAFTTESFLMARNPDKLIPVGDVQTAWDYKTAHPDTVLCGERGGTRAIACYIKRKKPCHVSLVCMGLAGARPTDEDTLCAEYIKSLLDDQPLEDLAARIEALKVTDGANFLMESRASVAAELYHAGRCDLFITTGGVKWDSIYGHLTEARILARHMMDFGVPAKKIILEEQSTTTHKNYKLSKPILVQQLGRRRCRIATVSSYGHLVRAVKLAYAYIPEHDHVAYRAEVSTASPERFAESPEMHMRAMKECRNLLNYVNRQLVPDFPIA